MHTEDESDTVSAARRSRRRVRRHARDVALGATLVALVFYFLVCVAADLTVLGHLSGAVDTRLAARLASLVHSTPPPIVATSDGTAHGSPFTSSSSLDRDDLDDAPVFAWWLPTGSSSAHRLDGDGPRLPLRLAGSGSGSGSGRPRDVSIDHRTFRLVSARTQRGRFVAATSIEEILSIRATLVTAEGAVLPIVLFAFFLVAYAIGRRAAAPVERARTQQLDFTADASHELRTPLSVIEAEVGLALAATRSGSELRGALERVGQESHRLRGIVEDLLWLARVDALPEQATFEAVDLAVLVEQSATRFDSVARQQGATLTIECSPASIAIVRAPAEWLDRLVSVLLDNACRYVDQGGQIAVRVTSEGGRSTLRVHDSGPGIAPEDVPAIFQRFRRASFAPGGAGLGLAIADTIVQGTGGRWAVGRSTSGGSQIGVSWAQPSSGGLGASRG